jgi:hypothetical protein
MTRHTPPPGPRSRASYTAEIITHTTEHPFASVADNRLLAIVDLNQPRARSVTNAIDEILMELREQYGMDLPALIIYRDSRGVWDGVAHLEGTFRGFYPINETDLARAADKALNRHPKAPRSNILSSLPEPQ